MVWLASCTSGMIAQCFSMGLLSVSTVSRLHLCSPTLSCSLTQFPSLTIPAAFIFAIAVYLSVGVPASRTIATPVQGVDTREDQIEALRILSAGNVIMIVLLGAILTLQVRPFHRRNTGYRSCLRYLNGLFLVRSLISIGWRGICSPYRGTGTGKSRVGRKGQSEDEACRRWW